MRISTSQIYDAGTLNIQRNQSDLFKLQNQISSMRKILTPADDPVGASQVLVVSQSAAVNAQQQTNQGNAASQLGLVDSQLTSLTNLLQSVRYSVVQAGGGALTHSDRQSIANDLESSLSEMLGIANSDNGSGDFLFSGYQGGTRPFAIDPTKAAQLPATTSPIGYFGDEGQRLLQVSSSRQMAVSVTGSDVFMNGKSGNGTFVTATAGTLGVTAPVSNATINAGTVLNQAQWTAAQADPLAGMPLEVRFADATHYGIYDPVSGLTTGPLPYTPGVAIPLVTASTPAVNFAAQVVVSGTPAAGESFTISSNAGNISVGVGVKRASLPTADGGTVLNRAQYQAALASPLAGAPLEIRFTSPTQYGIYDPVSGLTTGPLAYTSGAAIPLITASTPPVDFAAQVVISGVPVAGDSVTIKPGNNQGSATVDPGSVLDPQQWTAAVNNPLAGQPLEIRFSVAAGVATYGIYDPVSKLTTGPLPYTPGQAIPLKTASVPPVDFGSQVIVSGTPANGDTLTVTPSTSQSVFQTMQNLIGILRSSVGSSTYTRTQLANDLGGQLSNIDQAMSQVSQVQATVGTSLRELDSLSSTASDLDIQYKATLSDLQDLDYAAAFSDFTKQQLALEAAQKSFVQISGLSLFNYL
jgi:flagellar hook-associated protein 3 FlgL